VRPQKPTPVTLNNISFVVLSVEKPLRTENFINNNGAAICLSIKNYELLSLNLSDILRYLEDMRNYTMETETLVDEVIAEGNK